MFVVFVDYLGAFFVDVLLLLSLLQKNWYDRSECL